MATHGRCSKAIGIALDSDRRVRIEDLRSGILLMLGAWIAYFVVVELFIRTFDRIIVPVLDVPMSTLLAAQGCALLFLATLYLVTRHGRGMV